jgi:hypothetical protein
VTSQSSTGTTTKERESSEAQQSQQAQADESDEQASSEESSQQDEQSDEDESLETLDRETISEEYTVRELRDELRSRDLKVGGTKSELINRLLADRAD